MEIAGQKDDWKYKFCRSRLAGQYLSITMQPGGNLDSPRNNELKQTLDNIKAVKIGNASWVAKTQLSPQQVVELIRRHIQGDDYAHVFTLCGDLAWAGPLEGCRFFEALGIVALECDDIPNPVDPSP
jgi:hypothetical protein